MPPKIVKLENHGNSAERNLAKRLGGQQTPGSGALDSAKGDVKFPDVLLESKATVKDSMSVKLEWLRKIEDEAAARNRTPALAIQFVNAHGQPVRGGSWVAVPEHIYRSLTE